MTIPGVVDARFLPARGVWLALVCLLAVASAANAAVPPTVRSISVSALQVDSPLPCSELNGESGRTGLFPGRALFQSMLADPKQPRFFASLYQYSSGVDRFTMGSVGFGESFGLYRWRTAPGTCWQVGLQGGVFSQFNMNAPSTDLINTDFTIGPTLSYRKENWSIRLRLYHQSSHLGDEFLLRASPERINLSFESLEGLVSYEFPGGRVYGGGELLIRKEPDELDPGIVHVGLESRNLATLSPRVRWVGGVDVKSMQEHDWAAQISVKTGLQFTRHGWPGRRVSLLLEAFKGHSPYGQFYEDRIAFLGAGVFFGL